MKAYNYILSGEISVVSIKNYFVKIIKELLFELFLMVLMMDL